MGETVLDPPVPNKQESSLPNETGAPANWHLQSPSAELSKGSPGPPQQPRQGQAGEAPTPGSCSGNVLQGWQVCACCFPQHSQNHPSPPPFHSPAPRGGGEPGDPEELEQQKAN